MANKRSVVKRSARCGAVRRGEPYLLGVIARVIRTERARSPAYVRPPSVPRSWPGAFLAII